MLSDAKKEQIKLRATFVNNIGIGVILVGVFTPIVRALYEPSIAATGIFTLVASTLVCFSIGLALHWLGSLILRDLNK